MSDTVTAQHPPSVSDVVKACRSRVTVFGYDLAVVFVLFIVGILYVWNAKGYWLAAPATGPDSMISPVEFSLRAMWFGALGGIVISLKGVYDHCCARGEWDQCFDLWHFGRPISGALSGLITLILLLSVNPNSSPSQPAVYAIAFIFGTQERRFFNFLFEVAGLVVRVPNEDQQAGLKGMEIQPSEGKAGDLVLITGRGFVQGASVTIGTNKLTNVVVAKDGRTIVGTIPAGALGAADVTVANPDGDRVILPGKFTLVT
jgi:IPT/TIG domain